MATTIAPPSINEIAHWLPAFCESHGIARVEVFGSVATGEALPGSDVDLMVTFRPGVEPGLDFFAMQDELEQILGCTVDVLTRRSVERSDNRYSSGRSSIPPVKSMPDRQAARSW
jgi:predicted nucleotidyltransferase